MKTSKYRVVRDCFAGYEVQKWRWWFPFWMQCHDKGRACNTWGSLEKALEFVALHKSNNVVWSEE